MFGNATILVGALIAIGALAIATAVVVYMVRLVWFSGRSQPAPGFQSASPEALADRDSRP